MTSLEATETVSHETNHVETFIVVDVETSGLVPAYGKIFTIGAVAVTYDGRTATINKDFFYQRIDQWQWIEDSYWLSTVFDPDSTLSWWLRQTIEVQNEAWRHGGKAYTRSEGAVARKFDEWVQSKAEAGKAIFVANPVSFDKPWIDLLFMSHNVENPFDYRTLCLRSMFYGHDKASKWGQHVRTNKSLVPHHALFDAYAQAHDLIDLFGMRDEASYEDELYWLSDQQYCSVLDRCLMIESEMTWE